MATPLAWNEVKADLDLATFTIRTVPERLATLRADPWEDFEKSRRNLPELANTSAQEVTTVAAERVRPAGKATIVTAKAPRPRRPGR